MLFPGSSVLILDLFPNLFLHLSLWGIILGIILLCGGWVIHFSVKRIMMPRTQVLGNKNDLPGALREPQLSEAMYAFFSFFLVTGIEKEIPALCLRYAPPSINALLSSSYCLLMHGSAIYLSAFALPVTEPLMLCFVFVVTLFEGQKREISVSRFVNT